MGGDGYYFGRKIGLVFVFWEYYMQHRNTKVRKYFLMLGVARYVTELGLFTKDDDGA